MFSAKANPNSNDNSSLPSSSTLSKSEIPPLNLGRLIVENLERRAPDGAGSRQKPHEIVETLGRKARINADSKQKTHYDPSAQTDDLAAQIPPRSKPPRGTRLESTKFTCTGEPIACLLEGAEKLELLPAAKVAPRPTKPLQFSDSDDDLPDETQSTSKASAPKATFSSIATGLSAIGLYAGTGAASPSSEAVRTVELTPFKK